MGGTHSGSRAPTPFAGVGEPPNLRVDAPTWEERLEALVENYEGEWVKYGPFAHRKSAQNRASRLNTKLQFKFAGYALDSHVDDDGMLSLRVRKNKGGK